MRSRFIRLIAEVLVVFAGVYAAFALDEYRSRKQDDERKHQILMSLEKDFAASQEIFDSAVPQITQIIDTILVDYEAGRMPEIGHLAMSISSRSGTWDATLASGGVNILDIELIFAVEAYYESVQALVDVIQEGRRLSADLILPVIDQGNAAFYEAEGGKLKKSYRWYISSLQDYRSRILSISEQNREILESITDRLTEQRDRES